MLKATLLTLAALLFSQDALALDPNTSDPRAIMSAAEDREARDNTQMRLSITITDDKGRERSRQVQVRAMQFPEGSKQIVLFEKPADLAGAGLLSVDYKDGSQDDDQWLYLPSVGKTTRIASADKSGSFMGTDLSYADMTRKDPNAYDYKMLEQSAQVDGMDCWHIEATPKTEKEQKETGYAKTEIWVAKDSMIPVQVKAWVLEGKRLKYTKLGDIREVDGTSVAHMVTVRTTKSGEVESTSVLVTSDLKFNSPDVTEADFTEQRLERGL